MQASTCIKDGELAGETMKGSDLEEVSNFLEAIITASRVSVPMLAARTKRMG